MTQAQRADYEKARTEQAEEIQRKKKRADVFRIRPIAGADKTLINWLDIERKEDKDERKAAACVRDIADSLEVMVVQRKSDGRLCLLPWIGDENKGVAPGAAIATERVPEEKIARVAAVCTVSLPMSLCAPRLIDTVIKELEDKAIAAGIGRWQESFWLEGLLPLILDETLTGEISGYTVTYRNETGLSVTRKETRT
jgi:CRISPR-associated endonuclease/helicase Cas3